MIWVAVDPGARTTGIIARHNRQPVAAELVRRTSEGGLPDADYLTEVIEAMLDVIGHQAKLYRVCVEGINRPSGHMRLVDPLPLVGTGMVLGAVLAAFPDALVVPPGGHGSGPLSAYPPELVGPNESRGSGKRRHLRSAWDISLYADSLLLTSHAT